MKPRFLPLFAVLPLVAVSYTQAQSIWTGPDGGTWGTAANWSTNPVVPNSSDAAVIINGAGSGSSALDVALDGVYTIGTLTRDTTDGTSATFPTSPTANDPAKGLTLQTTAGQPQFNITGDVFFYSAIFGTQGFEKTGPGRLTLRFNTIDQTFTGPIKISAGTLGIQKDTSLGDVNNDIEIADGAKLWAEPGANSGIITMPVTRSITLGGAAPQIGSNNPAVNLIVEGGISDGSNGYGMVKTDPGVVTLAGSNSWTGDTVVNAGVLSATAPAAFPGYDSQVYNVNGTGILAVRYGDASSWTDTEIGSLMNNVSFNENSSLGFDTTGNTSDAVFALDLVEDYGFGRVAKVGPGKLTLSNAPNLTRLTVFEGTLALGATSIPASDVVLAFTKSGSTLDLGTTTASASALTHVNGGTTTITNGTLTMPATYSFAPSAGNTVLALPSTTATFGRVQPFGGGTTTINGAGGSLTVNGDFNFDVNSTQNTRLVMSGLSTFTYNRSNRAFRCLPVTAATDTTVHELVLANGTNTVTANLVQVGGATGTSQGNAHQGQLRLGTTNDFRTPTFQIGAFNGSGVVSYQAGLTAPSFKLRAADGTSPATTLLVGDTSSGVRSGAGTLDLSTGTVDISATSIMIGRHIANSASPATTSAVTVQDGTVSATTLTLVRKQGGGSPATIGNFNHNGGDVTVDDLVMVETADNAAPNVASATQNLQANYNLNGGTLTAGEIKRGVLATPITAGNTQRNLILKGGTLINQTGADLAISGVTVVVSGVTSTVVDSTPGQKVVLASDAAYSARLNSINETIGTLTVDGALDLSASPAFSIFDDATGDAAPLDPGTKLVLIDYSLGSVTGTFAGLADGATISVTKGAVTNDFVLDYDDPDYGGKAVTLTIPGAGNTPPTISDILDQSVPSGGSTGALPVTVGDGESDPGTLIVTGSSSNTTLVPNGNIVIGGSGASRTVTVTPVSGLSGTATITVTVDDGTDTASDTFVLTVTDNYLSWATANSVSGGPEGDSDNDGVKNLVEYALVNGGERGMFSGNTITFTKRGAPYGGDITYDIESSTLLTAGSWTTLAKPPVVENATSISYTFTPGSPAKNFARLKVVQTP